MIIVCFNNLLNIAQSEVTLIPSTIMGTTHCFSLQSRWTPPIFGVPIYTPLSRLGCRTHLVVNRCKYAIRVCAWSTLVSVCSIITTSLQAHHTNTNVSLVGIPHVFQLSQV